MDQNDSEVQEQVSQSNLLEINSLTIADCALISDRLKVMLKEHSTVSLDFHACEDVDTSGIQLLTLLQVDPETVSRVHWRHPHPNLTTLANRLGLGKWIQSGLELV